VSRVPPSLANAGNSCYANSVIQCLLATRPLRNYLLSGRHDEECVKPSQSDWCLVCELQVGGCAGGA
jgi:ubiquitin carboxyl-terminal hydrolase 36/42